MILLVSLVASNIILALLVILALVKITRISQVTKPETHKNTKIPKKLEKSMEAEIEKLMASFRRRIDVKLAQYFQVLADDAAKKGTELAAFVEKQHEAIVKETQFLAAQDVAKLKEDLEKYKNAEFAQIDQKVNKIVADTARQVLGKAIDVSTHEELVRASLEKAKKENFF